MTTAWIHFHIPHLLIAITMPIPWAIYRFVATNSSHPVLMPATISTTVCLVITAEWTSRRYLR